LFCRLIIDPDALLEASNLHLKPPSLPKSHPPSFLLEDLAQPIEGMRRVYPGVEIEGRPSGFIAVFGRVGDAFQCSELGIFLPSFLPPILPLLPCTRFPDTLSFAIGVGFQC
jgi:hypothetical protein